MANDNGPWMFASPSTSGQANRSCFIRPVNLNADGFNAGATGPKSTTSAASSSGPVHKREANPAQTGFPWFDRRQCQCGRDGGVDRVSAGVQDGDACLGRASNLGHHDAALPLGRRLRQGPVLGEMGDGT